MLTHKLQIIKETKGKAGVVSFRSKFGKWEKLYRIELNLALKGAFVNFFILYEERIRNKKEAGEGRLN